MRQLEGVLDAADFLSPREKTLWSVILSQVDEYLSNEDNLYKILNTLLIQEKQFWEGATIDVFSPWMIKIPYAQLRDFGSPDDIESPLGFLKLSLPFPQLDPDYLYIYAPCILSSLERYKYGPELMAAYSWNIYPNMDIKELYTIIKKKSANKIQKFFGLFSEKVNKLKADYTPLYSLSTSQHFYEEGRRFYSHPEARLLFIVSTSPGVIIPEEYYGEEIYFPGITKVIPPGSLSTLSGIGFENWRFRLRTVLFNGQKIKNPFRTIYFDEGIGKCSRNLNYGIFWAEAVNIIKSKIRKWAEKGLKEEYIEDLIAVVRYFIERSNINIVKLNIKPKDKLLYTYTLMSEGYWFVSERRMKRIRRGLVLNIPVIKSLISTGSTVASTLVTHLPKLFEIIEGLVVGSLARFGIEKVFERNLHAIEKKFENGINLKEHIYRNYGAISEDNLEKWIYGDIINAN